MSQENPLLTLCPKCDNYPLFYFNKEKPTKVLIHCNHCLEKKYYSLHNYLHQISTRKNDVIQNYCNKHHQIYNNYCVNCKLHICCKCKNHQLHKLISLSTILPTITQINKINIAYNHINSYCYTLKSRMINQLLLQINQLEYTYQKFQIFNNDILHLLELIIKNYSSNTINYYLRCNIGIADSINIYQYKKKNTVFDIIEYYNEYTLIKVDSSNFNNTITINKHKGIISSLILLSDGRLASCSFDNTIKIYNRNNYYNCDLTLKGHTWNVPSICQLENNKLVSCSYDRSIKIWSIFDTSYKCDHTIIDAHSGWISKIILLPNNRMASCSDDKTIKIWNSNHPYELLKTLTEHNDFVISIIKLKNKKLIFSESYNHYLFVWNLATYQCETKMSKVACSDNNSIFELDDQRLLLGGSCIMVLNLKNYIMEKIIPNSQITFINSFMRLRDGNILCECQEGIMCIFDIQLFTITIEDKKIHHDHINDLLSINEYQFVSCSDDETIREWKY